MRRTEQAAFYREGWQIQRPMPLIDLIRNNTFQLGIWRMEESLDSLSSICPLPATISHPKRQREFWTLRALAEKMGLPAAAIRHTTEGKPYLEGSSLHISMSHSSDYACLCLSDKAIGIDIEQATERLRRIQGRYLNDEELRFLRERGDGEPLLSDLLLYWCAKEAAYKALNVTALDIRKELCVTGSPLHGLSLSFRGESYRFAFREGKEYTWVCCLPGESSEAFLTEQFPENQT